MQKTKKKRAFFINAGLIVISLVISLFILEFAVRIFALRRVEKYINLFVSDDKLGWKLKPGSRGVFTSPEFLMEIEANRNGFRDISHDYAKPAGTFRIAGIGDSFLLGTGISYPENVLIVLQELLSKDGGLNKRVETINLGITGYNINQYYRLLRYEASRYSPDLVILFFFMNDWKEDDQFDFKGVNNEGYLLTEQFSTSSLRSFFYPIRQFLKTRSQLYLFIRSRMLTMLRRTRIMYIPPIDIFKKDAHFKERYSHTLKLIKEMDEICKRQRHCDFVLCIIPENFQIDATFRNLLVRSHDISPEEYDWSQPQKVLDSFCLDNKIDRVDLMPVFSSPGHNERYYFDIDNHWTGKGHKMAAQELFAYIKNNLSTIKSR